MEINKFEKLISNSNKIYIASHINPDGDNVGSILAMYLFLKGLKKNVFVIEDDKLPENLSFLPASKEFVESQNLESNADLFITLDCADLDRIGNDAKKLFLSSKHTINIDHHKTNTNFAELNIVDFNASATGELLFDIYKKCGYKINRDIATALFTSISSDTGSFKYDSVTPKTFEFAAELLKYKIDINSIAVNLYQNKSLHKSNLLMKSFNTLELFGDNKIGVVYVTDEMINSSNADSSDTDGIVEFVRDIEGIEVAIFFKIKKNGIKLSIRTKSYVDATKIVQVFGGGGHNRAAGASLELPYEDRKIEVLKVVQELI